MNNSYKVSKNNVYFIAEISQCKNMKHKDRFNLYEISVDNYERNTLLCQKKESDLSVDFFPAFRWGKATEFISNKIT